MTAWSKETWLQWAAMRDLSVQERVIAGFATVNHAGYRNLYVPMHPAARGPYVPEHRVIAERKVGRTLRPGEVVHHINCDRLDNRPENLEVLTRSDHGRIPHHLGRRRKHTYLAERGRS